jgi:hypothetical protein
VPQGVGLEFKPQYSKINVSDKNQRKGGRKREKEKEERKNEVGKK